MVATVYDIQGEEEVNQAREIVTRCNGKVLTVVSSSSETVMKADFNGHREREAEADIELCDAGFDVEWD